MATAVAGGVRFGMPGRRSAALACVLALFCLPAASRPAVTFQALDRDRDRVLSQAEFLAAGRAVFSRWDADGDGNIEKGEFWLGLHDLWDVDDDRAVTLAEYDDGWSHWFAAPSYVPLGQLDANADDLLTADEVRAGLGATRLYGRWTYDGRLGDVEFVTALYNVCDTDSDSVLTLREFEAHVCPTP